MPGMNYERAHLKAFRAANVLRIAHYDMYKQKWGILDLRTRSIVRRFTEQEEARKILVQRQTRMAIAAYHAELDRQRAAWAKLKPKGDDNVKDQEADTCNPNATAHRKRRGPPRVVHRWPKFGYAGKRIHGPRGGA